MNSAPRESQPHAAGRAGGRILAIDYGRRRIGLALSDDLHLTAQPLATLLRTNRRDDLRRLREIVREHGVREILVGHPVHLDGVAGEMAAEAQRFATRVQKAFGLPVQLYDERLTSWEADGVVRSEKPRRGLRGRTPGTSTRRGHLYHRNQQPARDHFAAAILLRDYLESGRHKPRAKG